MICSPNVRRRGIFIGMGVSQDSMDMEFSPDDIFFVSYPKSGNTWLRFLVGNYLTNNQCDFTNADLLIPDIHFNPQQIEKLSSPRFIKSHMPYTPDYRRVVYVARDGRDAVVSYYFYVLKNRKRYHQVTENTTFRDFLELLNAGKIDEFTAWGDHVNCWLDQAKDLLVIKYEEMQIDTAKVLAEVLEFSHIPIEQQKLVAAVKASEFQTMQRLEKSQFHLARELSDSDPNIPFVRKGQIGDWQNFFDDEMLADFISRHGFALERLNYIPPRTAAGFKHWKEALIRERQASELLGQTIERLKQRETELQSQLQQTSEGLESALEAERWHVADLQNQLQQMREGFELALEAERQRVIELQNQVIELRNHLQQTNEESEAALKTEKQRVTELRSQLQQAELVRARLINEMRRANESMRGEVWQAHEASRHQIQQLREANEYQIQQLHEFHNQQINEIQQQKKEQLQNLRRQFRELKSYSETLERSVNHLEHELEYRSTGKAAIRQLIKISLRKLRLFDLVYKRHQAFVPLYNFFFRDQWQPATIAADQQMLKEEGSTAPKQQASSNQNCDQADDQNNQNNQNNHQENDQDVTPFMIVEQQSSTEPAKQDSLLPLLLLAAKSNSDNHVLDVDIDMESPIVEVIVVARQIGIDVASDAEKLAFLSELIYSANKVLCIQPVPALVSLLQSMAKRGATVHCLNCTEFEVKELCNYGLNATSDSLGTWMITNQIMSFYDYDLICLNQQDDEDVLRLLQGRLSEKAKVIISGNPTEEVQHG